MGHKRVRIKLDRIKDNADQFKTAKFRGCDRWFYYDDTDNAAARRVRGVSPFEHFVSIALHKQKQGEIDVKIDKHWKEVARPAVCKILAAALCQLDKTNHDRR